LKVVSVYLIQQISILCQPFEISSLKPTSWASSRISKRCGRTNSGHASSKWLKQSPVS